TRDRERRHIPLGGAIKQRATTRARNFKYLAVVSGAEIDSALTVDRTGPHIRLLRVVNLIELRRQHQDAGVGDRNAPRVAFQQLCAAARLPNNRLTGFYG